MTQALFLVRHRLLTACGSENYELAVSTRGLQKREQLFFEDLARRADDYRMRSARPERSAMTPAVAPTPIAETRPKGYTVNCVTVTNSISVPGGVLTQQDVNDLFRDYHAMLIEELTGSMRCADDIHDVISETLESLLNKPPGFTPDNVRQYLLGIAWHKRANFFRKRGQKKDLLSKAFPIGPDGIADLPSGASIAIDAIDDPTSGSEATDCLPYSMLQRRLGVRDRAVLSWLVSDRPSTECKKDLAARMDVTPSEISNAIKRIQNLLRVVWEEVYRTEIRIKTRKHNSIEKREQRHE